MKFGIKHLRKKTPKICKRIGNGLIAGSLFILGGSFAFTFPTWFMIMIGILGFTGKFITSLFTDEKD